MTIDETLGQASKKLDTCNATGSSVSPDQYLVLLENGKVGDLSLLRRVITFRVITFSVLSKIVSIKPVQALSRIMPKISDDGKKLSFKQFGFKDKNGTFTFSLTCTVTEPDDIDTKDDNFVCSGDLA